MRVCFISGEYPPMQGGVGDYTRELVRALSERGVEPHVITSTTASSRRLSRPTPDGIIVHPIISTWNWQSLRTIHALLTDLRPAVVHIQYQTAGYGMHPAINFLPFWVRRRRPNLCTVITYHDLRVPYLFPKAGRVRWWVTLAPAHWAHAVIVTNVEDRQQLETREPGSGFISRVSSRVAVQEPPTLIPIGSNIQPDPPPGFRPDTWRGEIGLAPRETMLLYFGFLNASKGGETLIRGLEDLTRQGYNCRLVMLGGPVGASDPTNQAYLAGVKGLIDRLKLADRVLWTGFVSKADASAYLMAADMAVLPYRDGASFRRGSLLAALIHGLPVVTTQPRIVGTMGHLPALVHGINALLVPPDDPSALARAIAELIDDPLRRRRLGHGARQLSRAFTWDKIAEQHITLYHQILGDHLNVPTP